MKGNAKISNTFLGYEKDHGLLTCFLYLEQDCSSQGFGGYRIDAPKDADSPYAAFWIKRILEVVGVSSWEELKGQYLRVEGENYGQITGIGHITKNVWFFPKKEIQERFGK